MGYVFLHHFVHQLWGKAVITTVLYVCVSVLIGTAGSEGGV